MDVFEDNLNLDEELSKTKPEKALSANAAIEKAVIDKNNTGVDEEQAKAEEDLDYLIPNGKPIQEVMDNLKDKTEDIGTDGSSDMPVFTEVVNTKDTEKYKEGKDQDYQKILIPNAERFDTISEDFEELNIDEINVFDKIPHFQETSEKTTPTVIRTPTSLDAIDGFHFIKAAKEEGKKAIRCHVLDVREFSDIELSLRKVEFGLKTPINSYYSEKVRAVKLLEEMLINSSDNPILYRHGGDRKSLDFNNNRGDNIVKLLAERLGKSVNSINIYRSFGRHVNDEVLAELVNRKMKKAFFESFRTNRSKLVRHFEDTRDIEKEEDRDFHNRITGIISERIVTSIPIWDDDERLSEVWKIPEPESEISIDGDEDAHTEPVEIKSKFEGRDQRVELNINDISEKFNSFTNNLKELFKGLQDNKTELNELIEAARGGISIYMEIIRDLNNIQDNEKKEE